MKYQPSTNKLVQEKVKKRVGVRRWQRIVTGLACAVVFCTTYMLVLPAITMSAPTYCGLEEHTHSEESGCYDSEMNLICELPAHTHGEECYQDPNAAPEETPAPEESPAPEDLPPEETPAPEENPTPESPAPEATPAPEDEEPKSFALPTQEELAGLTPAEKLVSVAESQVGSSGETAIYHGWYQDYRAQHPREDLQPITEEQKTSFINYCLFHAGIGEDETPYTADCAELMGLLYQQGRLYNYDGSANLPSPGDLAFRYDENGDVASLGILAQVSAESNTSTYYGMQDGAVVSFTHALDDSDLFFARLVQEEEEEELCEEVTVPKMLAGVPDTLIDPDGNFILYPGDICLNDDKYDGENDSVSSVQGYYRAHNSPDDAPWTELTNGVHLEGNEDIKISLSFTVNNTVSATNSIRNTRRMYYELPNWMEKAIDVEENVSLEVSPGVYENVAKLYVHNGIAMIVFNDDFESHGALSTAPQLSGNITVEGGLDLGEIADQGGTLQLGNATLNVELDADVMAHHGNIKIEKSVSELHQDSSLPHSYLEYTIKVTVGNDGDIPNVKVLDYLTNTGNGTIVQHYGSNINYNFIDRYIVGVADVTRTETAVGSLTNVTTTAGTVGSAAAPADVGKVYMTPAKAINADGSVNMATGAVAKTDSLVWDIGTAERNHEYTLTYKLMLSDDYVGFAHGITGDADGGTVQNKADLFADKYARGSDTENYTPKADLNVTKQSGKPVFNPSTQTFIIEYLVVMSAPADNSYTMTNAKLFDVVRPSGVSTSHIKYLGRDSSDPDAYKPTMYEGDLRDHDDPAACPNNHDKLDLPNPSTLKYYSTNPEYGTQSVTLIVGDLAPGESKTLRYFVEVAKEAFLNGNSDTAAIKNTAEIYDDEEKSPAKYASVLGSETITNNIQLKHWQGKSLSGGIQTSDKNVPISGDAFYDYTGGSLVTTTNPGSFTVSAPYQEYHVMINRACDWDMTQATNKDTISKPDVMAYSGWVRVDGYDFPGEANAAIRATLAGKNDTDAYNYLHVRTPSRTVWVKVDGETSFQYTLEQLGFPTGADTSAYTLTYYTHLTKANVTHMVVGNSFTTSGTVGIGEKYFTLGGITTSQTTTVTGSNDYAVDKQAWYYDELHTEEPFPNGELYWVVEASSSGSLLPNMVIRDRPTTGNTGQNDIIQNQSFVGLYIGDEVTTSFASAYADMDALNEAVTGGTFTAIDPAKYSVTYTIVNGSKRAMDLTINEEIPVGTDKKVYMVVKTHPQATPIQQNVKNLTYGNGVQSKNPDSGNWDNEITRTQTVATTFGISKDGQGVYKVAENPSFASTKVQPYTVKKLIGNEFKTSPYADTPNQIKAGSTEVDFVSSLVYYKGNPTVANETDADKISNYNPGNGDRYRGNYTYEPGIYLSWLVNVNEAHDMTAGKYSIVDTLPAGVELAYVRMYRWIGNPDTHNDKSGTWGFSWTKTIRESSLTAAGWTEHMTAARLNSCSNWQNAGGTFYYTNGNKIQICLGNVYTDETYVYQVVCRVTDPDVLQGGMEKTFVNTAQLYPGITNSGGALSTVTAPITVQIKTLDKKNLTNANNGAIIPFEIVVNELGGDMNPGGNTLTLVDEMGKALVLDMNSITVNKINTDGTLGAALTQNTSQAAAENPELLGANEWMASYHDGSAPDTKQLRITVPDRMSIKISYRTRVNVLPGEKVSLSNTAFFEGYAGGGDSVNIEDYHYNGTAYIATPVTFAIRKIDSTTMAALPGAEFKVTKLGTTIDNPNKTLVLQQNADGTPVETSESFVAATGSNGQLIFDEGLEMHGSGHTPGHCCGLGYDTIYKVEEVEAPSGYVVDSTPHYFVVTLNHGDIIKPVYYAVKTQYADKPLEITAIANTPYYTYEMTNDRAKINVVKKFGGNGAVAGTYRFGIWTEDNFNTSPRPAPEQIQSIQFTAAETSSTTGKMATFRDLTLNTKYYIYELDDDDNPITGSAGTINGDLVNVAYGSGNPFTLTSEKGADELTVTNTTFKASITKSFDANREVEGAITGNYTFGLWEAVENSSHKLAPVGDAVEYVHLRWTQPETLHVQSKTAEFHNLESGKCYFIFEVDDYGQPILGDSLDALIEGKLFEVAYTTGTTYDSTLPPVEEAYKNCLVAPQHLAGGQAEVNVHITNTSNYYSLPHTGGMGIHLYILGGLTLMLGSLGCYIFRKKERNKNV